jgi:hypothetical protein
VAHLRVGLWHVRRLGEAGALTALRSAISSYKEAVGTANTDTSGYHETLTIVYVRLIADYLQRAEPSTDIADEAIEAALIAACGAREKLFSIEARRGWVAPDLKPLPARGKSGHLLTW